MRLFPEDRLIERAARASGRQSIVWPYLLALLLSWLFGHGPGIIVHIIAHGRLVIQNVSLSGGNGNMPAALRSYVGSTAQMTSIVVCGIVGFVLWLIGMYGSWRGCGGDSSFWRAASIVGLLLGALILAMAIADAGNSIQVLIP